MKRRGSGRCHGRRKLTSENPGTDRGFIDPTTITLIAVGPRAIIGVTAKVPGARSHDRLSDLSKWTGTSLLSASTLRAKITLGKVHAMIDPATSRGAVENRHRRVSIG